MQPKKARVLPALKIAMAEVSAVTVVVAADVVATTETEVVAVTVQQKPVPLKTTRWLARLTQQRPQKAVAMDAAATAVTALSVKRANRVKLGPSANHPRRHRWHALPTATRRIPCLSTPCRASSQTAKHRLPTRKAATTHAAVADAVVEAVEAVATGLIVVTVMRLTTPRALKNHQCKTQRRLQPLLQATRRRPPRDPRQRPMEASRRAAKANNQSVASAKADAAVVGEDATATGATPKTTHLVKFSTPKVARWAKPLRELGQPTSKRATQPKLARTS